MPRILVTNDDGVHAEGLKTLARALEPLGEVTIVAPNVEASAIGHALTLGRPLRIQQIGERVFAIDGTPTDCVTLAIAKVLGGPPDLIASGINKGYNLGDDITYSGTVAGALEGALLGIPSFAVSLQRRRNVAPNFAQAAMAAVRVADWILKNGLPARTFLNVNVPQAAAKGFRATVQAKRNHVTSISEKLDPRHQPYFWIEEGQNDWEPHDRSDYQAVKDGWISVTPLQPDLTDHAALALVEELSLTPVAEVK